MEHEAKLGFVVMAAGNALRFGANKLTAPFRGRPLIRWALDALPPEHRAHTAVVTQYPEIGALAGEYGLRAIRNDRPELGVSRTIALGLEALSGSDGVMFLVADQPLLRRESVAALADLWRQDPACIAALSYRGVRGNPCVFPARLFPELLALTGDTGGSAVIRRHPEALRLLEAGEQELFDVDTAEAMARLEDSSF